MASRPSSRRHPPRAPILKAIEPLERRLMLAADLVSFDSGETDSGNNASSLPVVSADGRFVVFQSDASNLTADIDANAATDIFVRDLVNGTTALVSVATGVAATGNGSSFSTNVAISADGRYVAFESEATNLVAGVTDTNAVADVFVRDTQAGTTRLVSHANGSLTTAANEGSFFPVMTPDGSFIAFQSDATD